MRRRELIFYAGSATLLPLAARAQQTATMRVARIGILGSGRGQLYEAFKRGLRDLGYVDGDNISIEYRWTQGSQQLANLAADLVRLRVDVIVASGQGAVAAKQATSEIPIVMPVITDPIRLGLVASLARPGGNATGFATQNEELPGKWLELLKEVLPQVSRVAVLFHPTFDGGVQLKASQTAARVLGVDLRALNVEGADDFVAAFADIKKNRAEALVVSSSPFFYAHLALLLGLAADHQLPTIHPQSEYVVGGGLMSYGPDFRDLFRRSATYVDKILKGARPADLPVQQPTKFELIINLKTAKALGITIPPTLLARADEVIE